MKLKFSLKYFMLTAVIFLVEVLIATKLKDIFFIRAYLGDVIVVMLLYTFALSFFEIKNKAALIGGIFVFSVFIEVLQYFKTADVLGFQPGSIPYIVLGNSFSWGDILCYAGGCAILLIISKYYRPKVS